MNTAYDWAVVISIVLTIAGFLLMVGTDATAERMIALRLCLVSLTLLATLALVPGFQS